MNVADAVKADRSRRGNLSRKAYADLTGLTPTKIANIEGNDVKPGRKLKAGEREALEPHIADLLAIESTDPVPEAEQTDEWSAKRDRLMTDYAMIMAELDGKPARVPWPLPTGVGIKDAPPQDLEMIQRWVDEMYHVTLDDGPPPEPPTGPSAEGASSTGTMQETLDQTVEHPYRGYDADDGWDEVPYLEDVRVITNAQLLSVGPVMNNPTPPTEGGPGESQQIEALPDDFPVRDQR